MAESGGSQLEESDGSQLEESDGSQLEESDGSQLEIGYMDQTIATVKIGTSAKVFHVHKQLLCQQSPYFRNALSAHWKEGKENVVSLDDAEVETFQTCMTWFYTGQLPDVSDPGEGIGLNLLVDGYIFADRYDVPKLRNDIFTSLYNHYNRDENESLPAYSVIIHAFKNLPSSSLLCQWMVDIYGARWEPGFDDEKESKMREELSSDFLIPVMVKLGSRAPSSEVPDIGHYHETVIDQQSVK